jgi:hypothetical protein
MRHTLKASFEQQSDAQHLMEELSAAGFTGAELALSGATHAGPFTHRRPAVTLTVDSEAEAMHALGIIERCSPARLQDDLTDDDPDGAGLDAPVAAPATDRMAPAYPPGAEPGVLQFRHLDDGRYFGTQNAAAPPAGNTFQETMGTASNWNSADEYTMQQTAASLWPDIDVGDNDLERTAFRFGRIMRMDDRYRNRAWDEAEAALKLEWASFAQVASGWDEAKDSVRRGWDRTAPEIDDDSHYRSHWTTSHVHGTDAGEAQRSDAYRSRGASTAASDLEGERTARRAGELSAWGRFEDAVHHGWRRTAAAMPDDEDHAHHASAWHRVKEALRHGFHRGKS